jgi:hypothetical protein
MIAPALDEIEVSLFGGGNAYGECVVIHILNGQWMVFDSFKDPYSQQPIAIQYLKQLYPTDWDEKIITVNISHWHDDHIKGVSQIVSSSKNLREVCVSTALGSQEFMELVEFSKMNTSNFNGVHELRKILTHKPALKLVTEDKTLFSESYNKIPRELIALSPSDATIINANKFFTQTLLEILNSEVVKMTSKPNPNDQSVVNILTIGKDSILLGADLEVTGKSETGWERVLGTIHAKKTGTLVYKVPHHGSLTGYHRPIFEQLLERNVHSILTPWKIGNSYLPKKEGIDKLLSHSPNLAVTSDPIILGQGDKRKERGKSVNKLLDHFGINVTVSQYTVGQIRMRKLVNASTWNIEYLGTSKQL